jgi:hypothetical protein
MTKIGSATGGITPPISNDYSNQQVQPAKTEAPPQKTIPPAADTASASDAKGVMNSTADLMKKKLQDGLNPSQLKAGEAPPSKIDSSHPHAPLHPATPSPPPSHPHPPLDLNITVSGTPKTLINEKPAASHTEEKEKK